MTIEALTCESRGFFVHKLNCHNASKFKNIVTKCNQNVTFRVFLTVALFKKSTEIFCIKKCTVTCWLTMLMVKFLKLKSPYILSFYFNQTTLSKCNVSHHRQCTVFYVTYYPLRSPRLQARYSPNRNAPLEALLASATAVSQLRRALTWALGLKLSQNASFRDIILY